MKIIVPSLGESVTEATVAKWLKKEGEVVVKDDVLVELETDKATLEVYAQTDGILTKIYFEDGQDVQIGEELAELIEETNKALSSKSEKKKPNNLNNIKKDTELIENDNKSDDLIKKEGPKDNNSISPGEAIRSGAGQKITYSDLEAFLKGKNLSPSERRKIAPKNSNNFNPMTKVSVENNFKEQSRRIQMTRLQRTMAKRLKSAQNTAAMLTTFNEIDMSEVINIRNIHKEAFEHKYKIKLGFMSFFCSAVSIALKEYPIINSEIEGDDIIYHEHINLGIAVGAPQGLVVPVVSYADKKSFFEIEKEISYLSDSASDGTITTEQMNGATFTISNGGVYGSMLSTPIINPPQNAILGLHQIKERPVVDNGSLLARPIMYVALTYDHRAISGKEAVSFLKKVKTLIEHPDRMLIGL